MRFIKKHQRSHVVFDLFLFSLLLNLTFLSFPFITSLTTSIVNFKKEVNTVKSEHGHHQMTKYPSQLTRIIKQYRISRLQATSGTMTTQPENSNLNYFFEDRDHHNVKEEKVLSLAAWLHDTGYIVKKDGHEEESAKIAEDFLKE